MAFNRGPGGSQSGSSSVEDIPVTIQQGGTGATTVVQARANLGFDSNAIGTQPFNSVSITGGTITGISPLPVASGGTGASGQAEARTNLGIGSAGTQETEYFATAAQGTLADSAVQPEDLATVATTGDYDDLTNKPTLGTAAATDATDYATAAQGALADSAVQPGNLATVATSGDYDDLSNKPFIPADLDDLSDVVITTPTTNQVLAYDGTNWVNANAGAGSGDVVGPASATDNAVALFDGTTGKLIKDGGVLGTAAFDDTGDFATAAQGANADTAYGWGDHAAAGYLDSADIGVTVQGYDATIVVDADIGVTVQGYSSVLQNTTASFTTTDETKLDGIETGADVTDATNVAAAGAVMDGDFSTNGLMKRTGAGTYSVVTDNSTNWDTAYGWGNHASAGYLTSEIYTGTVTSVDMTVPTGLSVSGNPVTSSGTLAVTYSAGYAIPTTTKQGNWDDAYTFVGNFPSQTSQSGKYLTTNGSTLSWATVDALPSQSGNSGKYLTTDGTTASWANVSGGQYLGSAATKAIMYNAQSIAENITISGSYNALSAGPITIDSTYTVTVSSGAVWTIV